ncbi:MAG: Gfo/Idh/MocA family oxidoreductase [Armatimonadota bacterium]|nr:Gfo/Idh/MocA family oxidoreductase [Armatimonadota bacterium]
MERKVKVGFVGCGFMSQLAHLPSFASSANCEIVAIAEPREKLRGLIADKYGIKRQYSSHEEMLNDGEVEAVAAFLPDSMHAPVAIACLKAGKHVMIEKPMATLAKEAEVMASLATEKNLKLLVAFTRRFDPGVAEAKAVLDKGEIGTPNFAHTYYFGGDWICGLKQDLITTDDPAPAIDRSNLFPDWLPEELQGRYRFANNNMVHNYNLLRYLFGNDWKVRDVQITDGAVMVAMSFGAMPVSLEGGSCGSRKWKEGLELWSSDGWMQIVLPPPLLRNVAATVNYEVIGERHETLMPNCVWEWAFKRQAEHFLDCIINDKQPLANGADSLADMYILESIFRTYIGK